MTVSYKTIGSTVLLAALLVTPASLQRTGGGRSVHGNRGGQDGRRRIGERAGDHDDRPQDVPARGGDTDRRVQERRRGRAAEGARGVSPTGSVKLGAGSATPTRFTIERPTGSGRLLTILTDQPLLFVGAGMPGAKPKEGYDFAVIDIEVDGSGNGSGRWRPPQRSR